jgi:hypothetical protein
MSTTGRVAGALPPGTLLGKGLTVEKPLGRGGFAITYLCRAGTYQKPYAVKEFLPLQLATREPDLSVHPLTADDRPLFERGIKDFLDEGHRLQICEHKHVVKVEDFFNQNGTGYLVMEYIPGETLSAYLKRVGTLDGDQLMLIMRPALEALAAVHSHGLLHRDLSPSNIMLRGGALDDPVLIDFGAARVGGNMRSFSIANMINDGYSSPEHHEVRAEHNFATDLYSMGAIGFNALTGQRPPSAIDRKIRDALPGWGDRTTGMKRKLLVPVIDTAMSLDRTARFKTVAEMQVALNRVKSAWDGMAFAARTSKMDGVALIERADGSVAMVGKVDTTARAETLRREVGGALDNVRVVNELTVAATEGLTVVDQRGAQVYGLVGGERPTEVLPRGAPIDHRAEPAPRNQAPEPRAIPVGAGGVPAPSQPPEFEGGSKLWLWLLIGALAIGGAVAAVRYGGQTTVGSDLPLPKPTPPPPPTPPPRVLSERPVVSLQLTKRQWRIGEPFSFAVRTDKDCRLLIYTIAQDHRVRVLDPAREGQAMGAPVLRAPDPRTIPAPPTTAAVQGPAGDVEFGAICSSIDPLPDGELPQTSANEQPSQEARAAFKTRVDALRSRQGVGVTTRSYEVVQ